MTGPILAIAEKELAAGNRVAAIALIEDAARADNVDAIMQLAIWQMVGTPLRRDLVAARALLKRAVAIGHVDGALMDIALTANGSGGAVDWPGALHLLRSAAKSDYVAAKQLVLLDAMGLTNDGLPYAPAQLDQLSRSPNVWRINGFLTPDECRHIAETAAPLLEPATVIDPSTRTAVANPIRTSDGAAIGPTREDLVIRAVNHRIAAASNTPVENGEPLTILRYGIGQEYRPHVDTLPATPNQRTRTVLIYLNQGYGGGATHFLANDLTVRCNAGDAILFDNVLPDGTPDMTSRHAGKPVTSGSKWIATRWIRGGCYDPWTLD